MDHIFYGDFQFYTHFPKAPIYLHLISWFTQYNPTVGSKNVTKGMFVSIIWGKPRLASADRVGVAGTVGSVSISKQSRPIYHSFIVVVMLISGTFFLLSGILKWLTRRELRVEERCGYLHAAVVSFGGWYILSDKWWQELSSFECRTRSWFINAITIQQRFETVFLLQLQNKNPRTFRPLSNRSGC